MAQGEFHFAGAFRLSASLVLVMDAHDGTIVDINPAFERVIGYARDEVIGKRTPDFGLWRDFESRARIWACLRTELRVVDEAIEFLTRDGRCMIAQYATGRMTLDQAISWGEKEMLAIYNSKRRT